MYLYCLKKSLYNPSYISAFISNLVYVYYLKGFAYYNFLLG